jgi:hypothetical protein
VQYTAQEYIRRMAIVPVGYNVPQNEMCKVERLPQKGITLRVPKLREIGEVSATELWASGDEIMEANTTTGENALILDYDEYTMGKYGALVRVGDKAFFASLLDLVENVGMALTSCLARTMNALFYDGLVHQRGFQWMRVTGHTIAEGEYNFTAAGTPTITTCPSDAASVDDYWGHSAYTGQITWYTGAAAGYSRGVTDFANASGVFTYDTLPAGVVPVSGDLFNCCVLGDDGVVVGAADLEVTDTITLAQLYRALERCRRYGAGAVRFAGPRMTVTGIRRDNSADVANGVAFMPTGVAHDLRVTLAGNSDAQSMGYFNTSEGFRRAVGGQVDRIGGVLVVETNHFKRATATTGALSLTAGPLQPTVIMFQDAAGVTTLRDQPGRRQGLVSVMKRPGINDTAWAYGSLKAQGEMWVINKYFCRNALHGAVLWSGQST